MSDADVQPKVEAISAIFSVLLTRLAKQALSADEWLRIFSDDVMRAIEETSANPGSQGAFPEIRRQAETVILAAKAEVAR